MPTLQELREQRANVWSQMTEIMERTGGAPAGEDAATYDRAETDLDSLGDQIERRERHESLDRQFASVDRTGVVPSQNRTTALGLPADDDSEQARYDRVFSEFIRRGALDLEPADRQVLNSRFQTGDQYRNAAGVSTGAAGGFMVPPAFRDIIIETMLRYGPMLSLAEVFETESGVNLPWPSNDDTGNEGAILAENTQVTEQDVTLAQNSLDAFMYTSKLVRVAFQLLQDRPDFDTFLARKLGERLARIYNRHATVGTGTAQPDGIVTSATVGVTGTGSLATVGPVTYDNLVDLVESIDDAYLASTNPVFMMHQTIRKAIRKLKDTQGRPLWEPSTQAGTPDQLMGYGTSINNHMATAANNSKSLLFGDIREAYAIRIVRQNELLRLNERYADFLQVGFLAFGRMDGTLQNGAAVRVHQTTPTA